MKNSVRSKEPWVLGISASHNGAACLLHGSRIVAAVQEERLSRSKRQRIHGAQPSLAVRYCLDAAGISPKDLSMIVLCVQGKARSAEHDPALNPQLCLATCNTPTLFIPHHLGHAVSAFATSEFDEAAILVVDGSGSPYEDFTADEKLCVVEEDESGWETISLYHACNNEIAPLEKHLVSKGQWISWDESGMSRFGSLGGMYSAAAMQIFGHPMEAGKVMGLAPYGRADFAPHEFFRIEGGRFVFSDSITKRFRHTRRWPECASEYRNLARSVQEALDLAIMYLAYHLRELSDSQNLCYAGGVALNCIVNERLYRESGYENIYIPPAAEDSGPAIGAAYYGLWQLTGSIAREPLLHDSVGRRYSVREIEAAINSTPAVVIKELSGDKLLDHTVERLCVGDLVGWFQGGSELGPRALGQRSILADPRKAEAKTILNSRIKSRESFRPFAPAVLVEEAPGWLDFSGVLPESPFMLRVVEFRPEARSLVPAVVHVDGTGRVQTVSKEFGGRFYELIRRFYYATGIPILLNTSFNGRNEPIVETPEDALWCMLQNGLDFVVLEDRIVEREPGTESILDLYPRIISNIYSIDDLTQEASSAPRKTNLLANVTTRWGSQQKRIPGYYNTLLQAIDGRKNGWMLLEQLWSENGVNLDERWLIEALGALRRDSVITFQRIG